MSNTDFQNGFALGMASKGKAQGKEQETLYRFNVAELSNATVPNTSLKVLNFSDSDATLYGNTAIELDYILYTALQDTSTGEITELLDIPAQYDNVSALLNNSFNNFFDYKDACICNELLGESPIKLSDVGEILKTANYCIDYKTSVSSFSSSQNNYKAIGLKLCLIISFASEDVKGAVMQQLVTPLFSTNTHIGITYKKPAPIIDCGYIGG